MEREEMLRDFARNLLVARNKNSGDQQGDAATQGFDGNVEQFVTEDDVEELAQILEERVDDALISALPDAAVDKLTDIDADDDAEWTIDDVMEEFGVDQNQIVYEVLEGFKEEFLRGEASVGSLGVKEVESLRGGKAVENAE